MLKRAVFMMVLGVCISVESRAQTLRESVESGLHRSPTIQRTIQEARMALADVGTAKAARLPNISLEASIGPASSDRTVDGIPTGNGDWLLSRRVALTLQQLVFDFGSANRLVDAAKLREAYSDLIVTETIEEQGALVANTYVDVMRYRLQARLLEEKVSTFEGYRDRQKSNPKEGETDLVILKGRLATAQSDLALVQSRLGASEKRFQQLTLLDPAHLAMPSFPKVEMGGVDIDANPKVKAARVAVDSSKKNVEALHRDLYPKLFLEVQGAAGQDVLGTEGPDKSASALAVLRWDLFDGGRKRSALKKAEAEVGKQSAVVEEVRMAIDDDVNRAAEDLRGAEKRYRALSSSIAELTKGVADTEKLLDSGNKEGVRLMSVVAAYTEQSNARRDLVDATMDRYKAAYAVLAAGGRLLDYLGVDFNMTGGKSKAK